jgi:predicted RecB family nuclease
MSREGKTEMPVRLDDFRPYGRCGTEYKLTGKDYWFGPPEDSPEHYSNITQPKLREKAKERDRLHAKELCNACPVKLLCLRWALQENEEVGIWGGLTPTERIQLKNRNSRKGEGLAS